MIKFKKGLALFLIGIILFNIPFSQVFAESINNNENPIVENDVKKLDRGVEQNLKKNDGQQNAIQEEPRQEDQNGDESNELNNLMETNKISYLYVDENEINIPETQNIAVGFKDEQLEIEQAILIYKSMINDQQFEIKSTEIVKNTVLFTQSYDMGMNSDEFQLVGISYTHQGISEEISFAKEGIFASYRVIVNENKTELNNISNKSENSEVSVYSINENGASKLESGENIEQTVEGALDSVNPNVRNVNIPMVLKGGRANGNLVVAVCAGHDSTHTGAAPNGFREEDLNLKIAQYCKAELETYSGISVVMIRPTAGCPYPGASLSYCLRARIDTAVALGADIFLDLHLNTSGVGANGAEVYYPNGSYNQGISNEGKQAAEAIIMQLQALGLNNRGVKIRNATSENGQPAETDSQGNLADYYTTINYSKAKGIPGLIIEHAFMDGSVDSGRLRDESFLQKLGIADATGIASKYSLSKAKPKADISNKNDFQGKFDVKLSGLSPTSGITKILVEAWSEINGKDDLKSYTATKIDNNYVTTVNISNHNNDLGLYRADVYGINGSGGKILLDSISCTMQASKAVTIVEPFNDKQTQYRIETQITNSPSELSSIESAVWSLEDGQDDLLWYGGTQSSPGIWKTNIDINNHKQFGIYQVHTYATMKDGYRIMLANNTFSIDKPSVQNIKVENDEPEKGKFSIAIKGIVAPADVKTMQVYVWGDNPNEMYIYEAIRQSNGNYKADIDIKNHDFKFCNYTMHVYLTSGNGIKVFVGGAQHIVKSPNIKVNVADVDGKENTFSLEMKNPDIFGAIRGVQYAVWSEQGGQDDLIWYPADKNNQGIWTSRIIVKNHKTDGKYIAHAYVILENGTLRAISSTEFNVTEPKAKSINAENYDEFEGKFDVVAKGIESKSEIESVRMAVWSTNNQDNIQWYMALKQPDGTYKASVSVANHQYAQGVYNMHAYLTCANGLTTFIGGSQILITRPNLSISAKDMDGKESKYALKALNVGLVGTPKEVRFAVWSDANGQDDLIWYDAAQDNTGAWNAVAYINNHKTVGNYSVHVYVTYANGSLMPIGATGFNVTEPKAKSICVENYSKTEGKFDVVVKGVESQSGIENIRMAIWSTNNQENLQWYMATKQSNGTYKTSVSIANHQYLMGMYNIHTYVSSTNGLTTFIGGNDISIEMPDLNISAKDMDGKESQYALEVKNLRLFGTLKQVRFGVWSDANGQDDLMWYNASQDNMSSWKAIANIINHKSSGNYSVHVYITFPDDRVMVIGTTGFKVTEPKVSDINVQNYNESEGKFDVIVKGVDPKSEIKNIRMAIWSTSNQSNLQWYTATKQSDGTYKANVSISNHQYEMGLYNIHTYLFSTNGLVTFVGGNQISIKMPKLSISAKDVDGKEMQYALKIINSKLFSPLKQVRFAVWSDLNGQDDLIWYDATQDGTGVWNAMANIYNHKTAGIYNAHAYIVLADGTPKMVGATNFKVSMPSIERLSISNYNNILGTFDVEVGGVNSISGIKKLEAAVWSASNQNDIKMYNMIEQGANLYKATVSPTYHSNHGGMYNIHIYLTSENGIRIFVGAKNQLVNAPPLYSIVGNPGTTIDQMVRYFMSMGIAYPSETLVKGQAGDIYTFCRLFYEEAIAEGIRPEVAFTQAMLETGWLRFGGTVKIEQFNFCGLGATDINGAVNSAWFPDVRTGIRAQIQHLKAYASNENLNNICVDPRFNLVKRNSAPYVEWLGQKENPNGYGWATGAEYGYKIINMIHILQTK